MSLNRNLLKLWFVSATCLVFLVMGINSGSAAPCRPCDDWSTIKCCFSKDPCDCCSCTKDLEMLYYYYLYCLQGDTSISPNDLRVGKYHGAYAKWSLLLSKQAPAENATWGAIKSLFSAK